VASFDVTVSDVYCPYLDGTFSWSASIENRGSVSFSILQSKADAQVGDTIGAFTHGVRIFGGKVRERRMRRASASSDDIILDIDATSWEQRLESRYVKAVVYEGKTAGQIFTEVWTAYSAGDLHLGTIDPGASAVDLGRIIYRGMSVAEVFTDLANRSAYVWWVDPDGFIQFKDREAVTEATLHINPPGRNYRGPEVRETVDDYYNKVNVEVSWDSLVPESYPFAGNGSAITFPLLDGVGNPIPVDHVVSIFLNSVEQAMGVLKKDTGKSFYWEEGSHIITQDPAVPVLTVADQLVVKFYRLGANVLIAMDDAEIAARASLEFNSGIYETWIGDQPDVDSTGAFNRAKAFLDGHVPAKIARTPPIPAGTVPVEYSIECDTYLPQMQDVRPGVVINVEISNPPVLTKGLVTSVSASDVPTNADDLVSEGPIKSFLRVEITMVEYRPVADSVEFYKALAETGRGGGRGVSTSSSGSAPSQSRFIFYDIGEGMAQLPANDVASHVHFCQDGMLIRVMANQKAWESSSGTSFDVKWSSDGSSWASIFSSSTPAIPNGVVRAQFFGGLINTPMKMGYLTRLDVLSGLARNLFVTIEYGPPSGPSGSLRLDAPVSVQDDSGENTSFSQPPKDWGQFPVLL
jgi:hypothetical protein